MSTKSIKADVSIVTRPQTSPPDNPETGEMYFDSTAYNHKFYNGYEWINIGTPSGAVLPFASNNIPPGYLLCDGSAINRVTYKSLFNTIGIVYGPGDSSTTFNLPDYRGCYLKGTMKISSVTGTGTAGGNAASFFGHNLITGMRVRLTSGTLSGLSTATNYYVIAVDDNTLAFASSRANAFAGTRLAISGANSAVIQQWVDADSTSRLLSGSGGYSGATLGSVQEDLSVGTDSKSTNVYVNYIIKI